MERTKKEDDLNPMDTRIRYKKVGGGSFRFDGKIIKQGEIFKADPLRIPRAFRDVVIPLDNEVLQSAKAEKPVVVTKSVYTLKARSEGGVWYDIIDGAGKTLNEKALRKEAGEKLIEDLSK